MNKFDSWFKSQFGSMPLRAEAHNRLRAEKQRIEDRLTKIDQELRRDMDTNTRWTAALYAYQYAKCLAKKGRAKR